MKKRVKRYGVPYMGSKNFIAREIVEQLPPATYFYDLFAGGCAITHAAIESGKYKYIIANDIGDAPLLFKNAIEGKYKDEHRWISREAFFNLKESDPYIKYCWSFGNGGATYMYASEIEGLRHIQWDLCFSESVYERKILLRHFVDYIYNMGLLLVKGDTKYKGKPKEILAQKRQKENISKLLNLEGLQKLPNIYTLRCLEGFESLDGLQSIGTLQNIEGLQRLEGLQNLERLQFKNGTELIIRRGDYRAIEVKKDSIIYCDPPYRGCCGYESRKPNGDGFDYEAFYAFCESQEVPVFISEYYMPKERFTSIWQRTKRVNMTATKEKAGYKTENLFLCQKWQALYNERLKATFEPTLFSDVKVGVAV